MNDRARITDVSPRDGLQNESGIIGTPEKARLVALVARSGVDEVEVTSFVSPKWVPQLGDAAELFDLLAAEFPDPDKRPLFSALVPNEKGLEGALKVNGRAGFRLLDKVSVFTAASETFSKKNTNATIAETIERFRPVVQGAKGAGLALRGYVSCAIACPFEGPIAPEAVARVAAELAALGIEEIDLGDTIGAGTPETTRAMLGAVMAALPDPNVTITLHLHDTFGRAAACLREAIALGVRSFDGSVAGLGGCPYAGTQEGGRAPGNISTELLVRTAEEAGLSTGVDLARLGEAASYARTIVHAAQEAAR